MTSGARGRGPVRGEPGGLGAQEGAQKTPFGPRSLLRPPGDLADAPRSRPGRAVGEQKLLFHKPVTSKPVFWPFWTPFSGVGKSFFPRAPDGNSRAPRSPRAPPRSRVPGTPRAPSPHFIGRPTEDPSFHQASDGGPPKIKKKKEKRFREVPRFEKWGQGCVSPASQ